MEVQTLLASHLERVHVANRDTKVQVDFHQPEKNGFLAGRDPLNLERSNVIWHLSHKCPPQSAGGILKYDY